MTLDRHSEILAAVVTRITGLGFTLDDEVLPVLLRKATLRRRTLDPKKMISVSKSATPEAVSRWTFRSIRTDVVIDVVLYGPYGGNEGGQTELVEFRDTMVTVFSRGPLPGASGVFDLRAAPADWLRPTGETTEYDVEALQITASVVSANE